MVTIFILVGISGAGKSTFLEALTLPDNLKILPASNLIQESKAKLLSGEIHHDELRFGDINDNQMHLIRGFQNAIVGFSGIVILDAHVIIDTPKGLFQISEEVFRRINVNHFIHLRVSPERIYDYRNNDSKRSRPKISINDINDHQEKSIQLTSNIASSLDVPFSIISHNHSEYFKTLLNISYSDMS